MMLNHMITNTMKVLYFDVDPYEHYVVEEETAGQNLNIYEFSRSTFTTITIPSWGKWRLCFVEF